MDVGLHRVATVDAPAQLGIHRVPRPVRLLVPIWSTIDWASLLIAIAAFVAIFHFKVSMIKTLAGAAVAGSLYYLLFIN